MSDDAPRLPRRDELAQMQIDVARQAPTLLETIAAQTDANLSAVEQKVDGWEQAARDAHTRAATGEAVFPIDESRPGRTILTGPDHDAYAEFCAAAAALEAHQRASGSVMERYKTALQRLSERAAKVGG